jgi:hypothetical protein
MDLLLYGLATEHLSRIITKDSVTAVLRAPFTHFKGAVGEGEVNEDVVGKGFRHAVGELLTCPFCAAQWAEPVKQFETLSYDAFCPSSSSLAGSLIHAMVGSFGGSGLRWRNRAGLVA